MKNFISLTVGLLLVVFLAACGGEDNSSSSSDDSTAEDESKVVAETEDEGSETEDTSEEVEEDPSTFYADGAVTDVPLISDELVTVSDESYDFFVQNYKLFPAQTDEDIDTAKSMVNNDITLKNLNKNVTPYYSEMLLFEGTVISVEENLENGETVSLTHVMDDDYESYEVLLYKDTGDILEDDRVRFWESPVGPYNFENISGGSTNIQLFFGTLIEKVQ